MNSAEQLLEQGRSEGLRAAIVTALSARAVPLSALGRARLASRANVDTLTQWLARAVTVSSEAEVFASAESL